MAQITKSITVDVAKRNLFQAIIAKQHDNNSRFLKVTLTNEDEVINIDSTSVVTINAERADGMSNAFVGQINTDGTVTVPLSAWMLALDDRVTCDISVVDIDGNKLTSTSFELDVEAASYSDEGSDEDIEDDENYNLLFSLLTDVTNIKTKLERCMEYITDTVNMIPATIYTIASDNIAINSPVTVHITPNESNSQLVRADGAELIDQLTNKVVDSTMTDIEITADDIIAGLKLTEGGTLVVKYYNKNCEDLFNRINNLGSSYKTVTASYDVLETSNEYETVEKTEVEI